MKSLIEQECDTRGCWHVKDLPNYRFCKGCLSDRNYESRWGKPSPDKGSHYNKFPQLDENAIPMQSLTESYIQSQDDDGWTDALDILYGDEDD